MDRVRKKSIQEWTKRKDRVKTIRKQQEKAKSRAEKMRQTMRVKEGEKAFKSWLRKSMVSAHDKRREQVAEK